MTKLLRSRTTSPRRTVDDGTCEAVFVDEAKVAAVRKVLEPDGVLNHLAETFRALADPSRVKILSALAHEELCVCDLAKLLGVTQSAVSHQLRILRNLRLVKYRREGKSAYYSLDDHHIELLLNEGMKHVKEGR